MNQLSEQTLAAETVPLVSLDDIQQAARRLDGVAVKTPVIDVSRRLDPSATPDSLLRLKPEIFQPIGAFKVRGAYNMVAQLHATQKVKGVLTFSSGNHGQAVAFAAHALGIPSVIVMPTTAAKIKVDGVRRFGGEVVFHGTTAGERRERGEQEAAARGFTIVPPFDHPWIIAGQGTVGLELNNQCPDAKTVYMPVGGGSMISGSSAALRRLNPSIRIVGVEPTGAAKMRASLDAGHPVALPHMSSIAEGLLAVAPGRLTFAHTRAFVDEIVSVSDEEMIDAMHWLFTHAKLVVEPSGAVGVAAYLRERAAGVDRSPAVAVLSGGNIDGDVYRQLLGEAH